MSQILLKIKGLTKSYRSGKRSYPVLKGLDLCVSEGSFVVIMGKSGSGKTTLLNIIGSLDRFDEGSYHYQGVDITDLDENRRCSFRNEHIGFVFQQFHLIETLTVAQNVELPLIYHGGYSYRQRLERVKQLLDELGLADKMNSYPNELSGGEQQRVSISRALVNNPDLILADEPTGSLDAETGQQVITQLVNLNKQGKTVLVVTHDEEMKRYATECLRLKDGVLLKEGEA